MNTPTVNTTTTSSPARDGLRRLISPWGFRHLRAVAGIRFAVGLLLVVLGAVALYRGADAIAGVLLSVAVLHFSLGYWQLHIARSAPLPLRGR